jgi:hypothetical protein
LLLRFSSPHFSSRCHGMPPHVRIALFHHTMNAAPIVLRSMLSHVLVSSVVSHTTCLQHASKAATTVFFSPPNRANAQRPTLVSAAPASVKLQTTLAHLATNSIAAIQSVVHATAIVLVSAATTEMAVTLAGTSCVLATEVRCWGKRQSREPTG